MKYMGIFVLALLASSVADAELLTDPIIDFGNVDLGSSSIKEVTVTNTGGDLYDFTVSMTGSSSEFSWTNCPSPFPSGGACLFTLKLEPQHYGKKRRKLNFDGYELAVDGVQNDVSLTIPVIGSSDPF